MSDDNLHREHRKRLRNKAEKFGFENLEEHEALELLLFYAIPRVDTNETAHRLLAKFGSLHRVFDAGKEALAEVDGVGESAAFFLTLLPHVMEKYMLSKQIKHVKLSKSAQYGEYMLPYFIGKTEEMFYMLLLDSKFTTISCEYICSGSSTNVNVNIQKVMALASRKNVAFAVIAHNHPSGFAIPSKTDLSTSEKLYALLQTINVTLLDHIIVSDPIGEGSKTKYGDFVSLADSGVFIRK